MKTIIKATLFSAITLALTGTSFAEDTEGLALINTVKEYYYTDIDATLTLGNALNTRKMCKDVWWTTEIDDRNRQIIAYSCNLTGYTKHQSENSRDGSRLKSLQERYAARMDVKKDSDMYIAFLENLDKQGALATFAAVKKQTPSINKMSLFVLNQTEEGVKEAGVPDKSIPELMKAVKLYNDALRENKALAKLSDKSIYTMMFEMTTKEIRSNSDTIKARIGMVKKTLSGQYNDLNMIKEEMSALERKRAAEPKDDSHTQLVQTIGFTMVRDNPMVVYCNFSYYDDLLNNTPKSVEKITNTNTCLKESYKTEYDSFYTNVFNKLNID